MRVLERASIVVIVLLLGITPVISFMIGDSEGTERIIGPPAYHNGFFRVNVTEHDGSIAEGYRVSYRHTSTYSTVSDYTDFQGVAYLEVHFSYLGPGYLKIMDIAGKYRHEEEVLIYPDEVIVKNITLTPPPGNDMTISGTVISEETENPVPGIDVIITGQDRYGNQFMNISTTAADGTYSMKFPFSPERFLQLTIGSTSEYRGYNSWMYTVEGKTAYEYDMELSSNYEKDVSSRMRFINSTSGDPITKGSSYFTYHPAENHHFSVNEPLTPDSQGWYDIDGAKGETSVNFYPDQSDFHGISITLNNYFIFNGTSMDIEVPVVFPDFVTYNISVRNSTDPIPSARITYEGRSTDQYGSWFFYLSRQVDSGGYVDIMVPAGSSISLSATATSHYSQNIEFTSAPGVDDELDIILEEAVYDPVPTPPEGDVVFNVFDEESGIGIQNAQISGSTYYQGRYLYESVTANETGVYEGKMLSGHYETLWFRCSFADKVLEDVTISQGSNDPITVYLERKVHMEKSVPNDYYITLKDTSGSVLPSQSVRLNINYGSSGVSATFSSDSSGKVHFHANPGSEIRISTDITTGIEFYNPYAVFDTTIIAAQTGGDLGDLMMFQRGLPDEILGFVKDADTGEKLNGARINMVSYRPVEDSRFIMGPSHPEGATLFEYMTGSQRNGLYRSWGMDHVQISCFREGYYPLKEIVDLNTRALKDHDILMEPLSQEKYYVNGTVVDQDGSPVTANLYIDDIDHPLLDIDPAMTDGSGFFSLQLMPGNYSITVYNNTITSTHEVEVTGDIEGLELELYPVTYFMGVVKDPLGEPVGGIRVELHDHAPLRSTRLSGWSSINTTTNATGFFIFEGVRRGTYNIRVPDTPIYDRYTSEPYYTEGWSPVIVEIELENRTVADLSGIVTGTGGVFMEGIPDVTVELLKNNISFRNTMTDADGKYMFEDVPFGDYTIEAVPPGSLVPVEGIRPGYLPNLTGEFVIDSHPHVMDLVLTYVEYMPETYVNITYYAPTGEDVFIDSNILISFSEVMNKTSVISALTIFPLPVNMTMEWDNTSSILTISHDGFFEDTLYTVTVSHLATSFEGNPTWFEEFSWNFTTGNTTDPWDILSAEVDVDDAMNVTFTVTAPVNLSIYVFVINVGEFLLEEVENGTYTAFLNGTLFQWETTYSYYFTDSLTGYERIPEFSGTFTTPEAPYVEPLWQIFSASVTTKESGTWVVEVTATENIDVWIVIDGVGSFELLPNGPGEYKVLIPYENFEYDTEYSYHFSDTEDGQDMAGSFSGTLRTPKEDSRSSSPDEEIGFGGFCCIAFILLLVLIIIVVVVVLVRKKSDVSAFEE